MPASFVSDRTWCSMNDLSASEKPKAPVQFGVNSHGLPSASSIRTMSRMPVGERWTSTGARPKQRSDGGVLMAATTELFDVGNPAHMVAARDIEQAVAPLSRMPPWELGA